MKYDPERAIDLDKSNLSGVFALFGWYGPYPSRPCDVCSAEEFRAVDWNLGYICPQGHRFGTPEEWAWEKGQYRG